MVRNHFSFRIRSVAAGTLWIVGATLIALSFAAPEPAASSASAEWSIVGSPNSQRTPADNFFSGVNCVSANDCWVVGYYVNAGVQQTLIQHWNGEAWAIVPSPNVSITQSNLLRSVACTSASDCWAVGSYSDGTVYQTLVQHWDGERWSIVPSANTSAAQYNYLVGVACSGSNDCWAIGGFNNGAAEQTLIQRWNGTSWALVDSPNTSATEQNTLRGVACVSASDCWAVGSSINADTGSDETLVQRWNGVAWEIVSSPNSLLGSGSRLRGVTCSSASDCWAVGDFNVGNSVTQTLIERWDGAAWSIVDSPDTSLTEANRFTAVACVSTSDCSAVGTFDSGGSVRTLIARWNGSTWSRVSSPNPAAAQNSYLASVSCTSGGECSAVGYQHTGGRVQTLAERWNGTAWNLAAAANARSSQNNSLLGVTCSAANDCWAVGSYFNGVAQQTLIQRWDGDRWEILPSPTTDPARANILYDVICNARDDCWAVGYHAGDAAFQTLILHWDGSAWTIAPSPSTAPTENNFLHDITCSSETDCWAVGFYDSGSAYQTLAVHWNGETWALAASANTSPTQENRLSAVTCNSATDCWAVGRHFTGTAYLTLVQRWNGSAWSIVSSPNSDGAPENNLLGVTCASADDCWAIGTYGAGGGTAQPLIEHWNGSAWSIVGSPAPTSAAQNYNFLRNVVCTSSTNCLAVGYAFIEGKNRTLIERWDGQEWTIAASPNTSETQSNFLFGLTCDRTTRECWAAGYHHDDRGLLQTLMLHQPGTLALGLIAIDSIERLANGHIRLQGSGEPGGVYDLQLSPDLASGSFSFLANITADQNGRWQYEDAVAPEIERRFYRLAIP